MQINELSERLNKSIENITSEISTVQNINAEIDAISRRALEVKGRCQEAMQLAGAAILKIANNGNGEAAPE